MKKCSILTIKDMQIKSQWGGTISERAAIIKKRWKITSSEEDVEKAEPLYIAGGNVNLYSHYGKQYRGSLNY
jgi:hypothetical protein